MQTSTTEPVRKSAFFLALAGLCWLSMQVIHEAGHVLHALVSGATIRQVVLHPLEVSRTELALNPHPQFVAWGGIVWGCLVPIAVALGAARRQRPWSHLVRFFAGFCLVANGVYFIVGTIDPAADPGDLIRFGAPPWLVGATGLLVAALGLAAWNGQAARFGIGVSAHRTAPGHVLAAFATLAALIALELAVAP